MSMVQTIKINKKEIITVNKKKLNQNMFDILQINLQNSSPMEVYSHALQWKNVISNQMFIFQIKEEVTSPFYSNVFVVV